MIEPRPSNARGFFDHGWLKTQHTFSFAGYRDPKHQGFRSLRVINEDHVAPGAGFGMHPHQDMEIVTYVLSGSLEHSDNMGNGSTIGPGQLQTMTAGTGLMHSERNPSSSEDVHLMQIWIRPERKGLRPTYAQKEFPQVDRSGRLCLVASRDGRQESLTINQDASLFLATLEADQRVEHRLQPGRHAWLQVLRGAVDLNGALFGAGDGAAASDESELTITGSDPSELLLFDLA